MADSESLLPVLLLGIKHSLPLLHCQLHLEVSHTGVLGIFASSYEVLLCEGWSSSLEKKRKVIRKGYTAVQYSPVEGPLTEGTVPVCRAPIVVIGRNITSRCSMVVSCRNSTSRCPMV